MNKLLIICVLALQCRDVCSNKDCFIAVEIFFCFFLLSLLLIFRSLAHGEADVELALKLDREVGYPFLDYLHRLDSLGTQYFYSSYCMFSIHVPLEFLRK